MKALLIVPSPEWRDRLVGPGACGSKPPRAMEVHRENGPEWQIFYARGTVPFRLALILMWDGVFVYEGWDRLRRQMMANGSRTIFAGLELVADLADLKRVMDHLNAELDLGEIVVLSGPPSKRGAS